MDIDITQSNDSNSSTSSTNLNGQEDKEDKELNIIKILLHLEYMNDLVNQINLYKKSICRDIYKQYIVKNNNNNNNKKKDLTYKKFYSSIFKNNRPAFIKKSK
jgi:hypothetical protein